MRPQVRKIRNEGFAQTTNITDRQTVMHTLCVSFTRSRNSFPVKFISHGHSHACTRREIAEEIPLRCNTACAYVPVAPLPTPGGAFGDVRRLYMYYCLLYIFAAVPPQHELVTLYRVYLLRCALTSCHAEVCMSLLLRFHLGCRHHIVTATTHPVQLRVRPKLTKRRWCCWSTTQY